jgi:drug/metabolite transporter (DMT)-like permease
MTRSSESWRRIAQVSGALGLLLTIAGYVSLNPGAKYHTAALLAFYGGFALVLSAIIIWYRHVPPRPPAPEEPEPIDVQDQDDE